MPRMRAWAWTACLAGLLGGTQADAASLVEVRVGRHAQFTRVVLETDAPVRYELVRGDRGEVRVRLFATAEPRRLGSKSPLLREVVVESDPSGSIARLALVDPDVEVREMVLQKPPRIVLDLTPGARAGRREASAVARAEAPAAPRRAAAAPPAAEAAREEVAPEPEGSPGPEGAERVEVAAEPVPAAEPAAEPAPTAPPAEEPAPSGAAPSEPEAEVVDEAAEQSAREAAAQAELDRLAGIPPRPEPAREPESPPAGAAPAPSADERAEEPGSEPSDLDAGEVATEQEGDLRAERLAHPFAVAAEESSGGALSFLPAPLDDPLVLSAVALLGGLMAVLLALRRRAARSVEREAFASPFAPADAFSGPGMSERSARDAGPWVAPAAAAPGTSDAAVGPLFASAAPADEADLEKEGPSIFDVAEETVRAADPTPAAPAYAAAEPRESLASHAAFGTGAREGDVMRIIEELERRLAHLETRLEEVVDAKERLERHVAAQTEELRVQRAAIARTQRVLRTVVKPDDLATEPIPKP